MKKEDISPELIMQIELMNIVDHYEKLSNDLKTHPDFDSLESAIEDGRKALYNIDDVRGFKENRPLYDDLVDFLMTFPRTWYPALFIKIAKKCVSLEMFKWGALTKMIKEIECFNFTEKVEKEGTKENNLLLSEIDIILELKETDNKELAWRLINTNAWKQAPISGSEGNILNEVVDRLYPEYDGENIIFEEYGWKTPDGEIRYIKEND